MQAHHQRRRRAHVAPAAPRIAYIVSNTTLRCQIIWGICNTTLTSEPASLPPMQHTARLRHRHHHLRHHQRDSEPDVHAIEDRAAALCALSAISGSAPRPQHHRQPHRRRRLLDSDLYIITAVAATPTPRRWAISPHSTTAVVLWSSTVRSGFRPFGVPSSRTVSWASRA